MSVGQRKDLSGSFLGEKKVEENFLRGKGR